MFHDDASSSLPAVAVAAATPVPASASSLSSPTTFTFSATSYLGDVASGEWATPLRLCLSDSRRRIDDVWLDALPYHTVYEVCEQYTRVSGRRLAMNVEVWYRRQHVVAAAALPPPPTTSKKRRRHGKGADSQPAPPPPQQPDPPRLTRVVDPRRTRLSSLGGIHDMTVFLVQPLMSLTIREDGGSGGHRPVHLTSVSDCDTLADVRRHYNDSCDHGYPATTPVDSWFFRGQALVEDRPLYQQGIDNHSVLDLRRCEHVDVHTYTCLQCGHDVPLKTKDIVRCRNPQCGYRILVKPRIDRLSFYQAR